MNILQTIIQLALCLVLALPLPTAAAADFTPGEVTKSLVYYDAWQNNRVINAKVSLFLDMDGSVTGMSAADQQVLDAVSSILYKTRVNLGVGMLPQGNGIRLEADLTVSDEKGFPVTIDAAANLDLYGASLESSLLPDQKVTFKWETLLAMAGMGDSEIDMLISLREANWDELLAQAKVMLSSYATLASQLISPYADTVIAWVDTLTTETTQNVAAADGLPAAATVVNIYLTEADMGNLFTALADQLDQDATMRTILTSLFAQAAEASGETAITCTELIAAMREVAASATNTESPIMFTLGMDASGAPLYGELYVVGSSSDASGLYGCVILAPSDAGTDLTMTLMAIGSDGSVDDGFSLQMTLAPTASDMLMQVYAAGTPVLGMTHNMNSSSVTTDEGMPGRAVKQALTMNVADGGDEVQLVMDSVAQYSLYADGGERAEVSVSTDMYVDSTAISTTTESGLLIWPVKNGFDGLFYLQESIPVAGVNLAGVSATLSSHEYDPATTEALAEFALETASSEQVNALVQALALNAQTRLNEMIQALPADALSILMSL